MTGKNRLAAETSPYLLQHADNPVHWWAWGPEALAAAKALDRPILLSVGYAACHWCHVMAHESFEDEAIAAVMNERFINIKVDREERPDIDTIYQQALALLGQQGGWPLTMFLTPDGQPYWGGTYFPAEPRYGRPGFPQVLTAISDAYYQQKEAIEKNVVQLQAGLNRAADNTSGGLQIAPEILARVAEKFVENCDPEHGGIKGAPKFPQTQLFTFLWRHWKKTGHEPSRRAVMSALINMAQGGIYDHLGGGFARYATDAEWLVPHFEKMLYDNALLLSLMVLVWQDEDSPLLAARIAETVGWVEREMIAANGAFAASLDADSEGEEGKFYVFDAGEIEALLGDDYTDFAAAYDVGAGGNWEGRTILNRRAGAIDWLGEALEGRLARSREILLAARDQRIRPGWDDKVLADWNGLMIKALAEAGFALDRPDWLARAETAFAAIRRDLIVDGRLIHSWRGKPGRAPAMLDDHAMMADAAVSLFEVTGKAEYLAEAEAFVAELDARFWDARAGGYFYTASDAETLIVRTKSAADMSLPSGNGVMVHLLGKLFHLTGKAPYMARAEAVIDAFSGELARNFFPLTTLMAGADFLADAQQIVIVADQAGRKPFLDALRRRSLPDRILLQIDPGTALPDGHPAAGKGQKDGQPTAYLCTGPVCGPPVTSAEALAEQLG